ncbi:LutC/YkgG family protein [Paenibacillus faecalis]|uniref:LutC/YkgG family protein n=1 Tax=Paenibacillus faecalis TaxID=2079532 RepID=UPI000D0F6D1E|nr:LUD domain-containing protein [Paenibacillus faecalis]
MTRQLSDQEWLAQLEVQSRKKQESFINGIAAKLNRPRVKEKPDHPYRGAPDFWHDFSWPLDQRIHQFKVHFEAAGGSVVHLADLEEAKRFIVATARELKASTMLRQYQDILAQLDLEDALPDIDISVWNDIRETDYRFKAAEADIGIVLADYAAAYTGSMVVLSSKDTGRVVSLLPAVLMAIIPAERLKTRLGEILVDFDAAGGENLPAGIHFISGPSRSADIENDLTIGVHGPGIVYALLVDHL